MLFKSAYLGDKEIVKAYKGNTLFYEKSGGDLPSGYTRVDNVYALDRYGAYALVNQSIDQNTRIELDFIANFDSNNLFYAYNSSDYEQFAILIYGRGTDVGVRIGGTTYRSGHTISDAEQHKFIVDSKKLYLDGDLILDFTNASDYSATKLSIFRYITSTEYSGTSKIIGVKLIDNDSVSLNLIPCLDASDVACLYDTVSRTTFYSADATPFSYTANEELPEGYTRLAWIAGTPYGTQAGSRFSIPINFDSTKILRVKAAIPNTTSQNGIFIYNNSFVRKGGIHLLQTSGKIAFLYGSTWQQTTIAPVATQIYDTEYSADGGWVDGTKQVEGITTDFGSNNFLTNSYYSGSAWFPSLHRIYLIQCKDNNNTLLLNCIPALDTNNKPCLYDTVSKTSYYSITSEDFEYSLT